ncbi:hypothetical protein [Robertmurraya kyonggiensis]
MFGKYPIKAVKHFTVNSLVGESVTDPIKFYENKRRLHINFNKGYAKA